MLFQCQQGWGCCDRRVGTPVQIFLGFFDFTPSLPIATCRSVALESISQVVLGIKSYNRHVFHTLWGPALSTLFTEGLPCVWNHPREVYTKMSVNHMFYTKASEKKRNKEKDLKIMSEFFAVCTHRFSFCSLHRENTPVALPLCSFTMAGTEEGDQRPEMLYFRISSFSNYPNEFASTWFDYLKNWLQEQAAIQSIDC